MSGVYADPCRKRAQNRFRDFLVAVRVSAGKAEQGLLTRNEIISAEKRLFIQEDAGVYDRAWAPDAVCAPSRTAAHFPQ